MKRKQPMEAQLEHDLDLKRSSLVSESDLLSVTVRSNCDQEARILSVHQAETIHESIAVAFACVPRQLEKVEFGAEVVEEGATFEDYGVEVGCAAASHDMHFPSLAGVVCGAERTSLCVCARACVVRMARG